MRSARRKRRRDSAILVRGNPCSSVAGLLPRKSRERKLIGARLWFLLEDECPAMLSEELPLFVSAFHWLRSSGHFKCPGCTTSAQRAPVLRAGASGPRPACLARTEQACRKSAASPARTIWRARPKIRSDLAGALFMSPLLYPSADDASRKRAAPGAVSCALPSPN